MNDVADATSPDVSRPVTTTSNTDHTLTIEQVADLYAKAGHPRTIRSLQRYCANGHLDSQKKETTLGGEIYLVTPQSVARHIAQIEELATVMVNALKDLTGGAGSQQFLFIDHTSLLASHDLLSLQWLTGKGDIVTLGD